MAMPTPNRCSKEESRAGRRPRTRRFERPAIYILPGFYPGAIKRNVLVALLYLLGFSLGVGYLSTLW
ncbi:hypothetical protein AArcCO_1778 [Halalkaliarchaeum sp. AArc-CO]|nr:hypothetical protein AArcCO_1778 [Halalkaliarchaeum sp. AArc-CO]